MFRSIVLGGAAVGVIAVTAWRFSRTVDVAPLPPPPAKSARADREKLMQVNASQDAWYSYIKKDAAEAGIEAPTLNDMARAFVYGSDSQRISLEPGESAESVGLELSVKMEKGRGDPYLTLSIHNKRASAIAYRITTRTSMGSSLCTNRTVLQYDAVLLGAGQTTTRSECVFRTGMALIIEQVEVMEVGGLAAFYLARLAPTTLGIEARVADGHLSSVPGARPCAIALSSARRLAIESGEISWRSLVDFYARHRCETYPFPEEYRYFEKNGERPLPAVASGAAR